MPPSLASSTKPTPGGREFSSRRSRRRGCAVIADRRARLSLPPPGVGRKSPRRPGTARKRQRLAVPAVQVKPGQELVYSSPGPVHVMARTRSGRSSPRTSGTGHHAPARGLPRLARSRLCGYFRSAVQPCPPGGHHSVPPCLARSLLSSLQCSTARMSRTGSPVGLGEAVREQALRVVHWNQPSLRRDGVDNLSTSGEVARTLTAASTSDYHWERSVRVGYEPALSLARANGTRGQSS